MTKDDDVTDLPGQGCVGVVSDPVLKGWDYLAGQNVQVKRRNDGNLWDLQFRSVIYHRYRCGWRFFNRLSLYTWLLGDAVAQPCPEGGVIDQDKEKSKQNTKAEQLQSGSFTKPSKLSQARLAFKQFANVFFVECHTSDRHCYIVTIILVDRGEFESPTSTMRM